ncbi:MAG: cystathionine beta-lyase [Bacteroidetes bacterium HGW-Bacteroidetes-17]|jgi:cystathionine beta-lyase|nr:MAG: cystathionine beta-lyase [Bacteroidetes bacterium HGW-Bacteroidetes-17]
MAHNFDQIIDRKNTNSIKHDITQQVFGATDLIPMWVADMDFATPPFIIDALKKRLDHQVLGYTIRPDSFNQSIIDWMDQRHGWKIEKEWIKFTPGIVPAINMSVIALSKPDDKILIQPPVYHPFFPAVTDHGRGLLFNQLQLNNEGNYEFDFTDLENKLKDARLFILCNPHNPVGRVWSYDDLKKIGDLCIKHEVIILSDEIHSDLILPGYKHIPIASISEEIAQRTITYLAPSKTFNIAGLSTSIVVSKNADLLGKLQKQIDILHLGMGNIFGGIALEAAYKYGAKWVDELNSYIAENVKYVNDFLLNNLPQIKLIKPEATYLLWLDFRELGMDEPALSKFLIEKAKLGFNKGSMFGSGGEGFQRMNVGCPKSIVVRAMDQLYTAISKM